MDPSAPPKVEFGPGGGVSPLVRRLPTELSKSALFSGVPDDDAQSADFVGEGGRPRLKADPAAIPPAASAEERAAPAVDGRCRRAAAPAGCSEAPMHTAFEHNKRPAVDLYGCRLHAPFLHRPSAPCSFLWQKGVDLAKRG